MKTMKLSVIALAILMAGFTSCNKDNTEPTKTSITKTDSLRTSFSATAPYTFFSFRNGAVVPNSDSATNKWDFGVRFVNIIVNSHASGPGSAGVITQKGIYDDFTTAPETGYAYDTSKTQMAINAGFTTGWYTYDPADPTHTFYPKAGQFFIFKTSDNLYVKMEILSVNYADFVSPTVPPKTLIYKFRYTYNPDGSRTF